MWVSSLHQENKRGVLNKQSANHASANLSESNTSEGQP